MDVGRTESIAEAAKRLGLSTDAVRKRARRGTLPAIKRGGRLRIVVEDTAGQVAESVPPVEAELRARVAFLEGQLAEAGTAQAELRRLLNTALTRIPALPAPEPETVATAGRRPWWQFWRRV